MRPPPAGLQAPDDPGASSLALRAGSRGRPRRGLWLLPLLPLLVLFSACDAPERGKGDAVHRAPGQPGSAVEEAEAGEPGAALSLLDRRHTPRTVGMDSTLLAAAVDRGGRQSRLHNMIVARHGRVELEHHFRGPPPDRPANVKSVSKSLLSAVVGAALSEGVLGDLDGVGGLDVAVAPYFPDYIPPGGEPAGHEEITLGHLLSMSSGLESTSIRNYGRWVSSPDWVRYALTRPVLFEPGSRMVYSTGNSHVVSALLTRASGRSTHALATTHLAEPLGIRLPPWPRDPQGIFFGGNDMLISPRDLLRFGELYRQGGTLDGREVLAREWVEESWRVRIHSSRDGNGYGLGWWARHAGPHEVRFAWGYGGQFLFVVPALELTVVFTSDPWASREGGHLRVLHDMVDDLLVPAAERGG